MQAIRPNHPLRRLFAGLVEDAFCVQVGVCDPVLNDYLADLLVAFTHVDRLNAIRQAAGKQLDRIASILAVMSDERPKSETDRDRSMYRQIGDYTLFWAGVYPEQLKRVAREPGDLLLSYVSQGKRSYAIVSELASENDAPPSSLFKHLSDDFESCMHGLGLVRRNLEKTPPHSPDGELIL